MYHGLEGGVKLVMKVVRLVYKLSYPEKEYAMLRNPSEGFHP